MQDYGVTDKGFVLKRMDTILEQIHADLSEGFGFDTRLTGASFLNTLIMTFAGQVADLWEIAQDTYYSKSPSTAEGVNLDNAVQYGGIRRAASRQTGYPLHCTGDDGTLVRKGVIVATDTMPEIRLYSASDFKITRENSNAISIKVAAVEKDAVYSVSINGEQFNYSNADGNEKSILEGIAEKINNEGYEAKYDGSEGILSISDLTVSRNNFFVLSDNLTTKSVTSIANFLTEDYGEITLPYGIVTKMINNISGFNAVVNRLEPIYGRLQETDIELRQSYIAKSALRSNTMIDSIVAELLNNVTGVESASGYENETDTTNERGMPPHSIEIIVDGGDTNQIAEAILKRKAGGIYTYGNVAASVVGKYGESIPVRFNRPEYLYAWMKVTLYGDEKKIPANYMTLASDVICSYGERLVAGDSLLIQQLHEGIYDAVSGVTYIKIETAYAADKSYNPEPGDYAVQNVIATSRQKVLVDPTRIEVTVDADS